MGTDHVGGNTGFLLSIFACYLATILLFLFLGWITRSVTQRKRKIALMVLFCISTGMGVLYPLKNFWSDIFRPLPLVMVILGIYLFTALLHSRHEENKIQQIVPLLVMTIFALLLLFKILLLVRVIPYGFALNMPATLLLVMVLFHHIPRYAEQKWRCGTVVRSLVFTVWAVLLLVHIDFSRQIYVLKTFAVGQGPDRFFTYNPQISSQGPLMQRALQTIEETLKKDETFVVLPEGVILNYLSRRPNPSPYIYTIPHVLEVVGEDNILASYQKCRPDCIIVVHRETPECGPRYLGYDYGLKITDWIDRHYIPTHIVGHHPFTGRRFGILIARRVGPW
jgi:ABC-type amino acid transport system permease subunit